MILKLDVYFLTFFYIINTSHGLFSVKENNLDGYSSELDRNEIAIKDIKKITNNINNEVINYSKQNIETPVRFFNKILIQRVIPHGMKPSGIEYDHKFETFYKPLIRIHKRKQDKLIKDMNENEIAYIIAKTPGKDLTLKAIKDDIDSELLTPFKLSKTELTGNEIEIIKNLKNIIKSIESRTQRIKAYDKVIKLLRNMLRSTQFEKSGEMNDPFAPGKQFLPADREVVTEKNKGWVPHYPPWNYWTYKKTLHQDACPGTQVKLGNICIWTPPH